jgi:hypothetical protein
MPYENDDRRRQAGGKRMAVMTANNYLQTHFTSDCGGKQTNQAGVSQ